jgi:Essential protein Yae1, N terminal
MTTGYREGLSIGKARVIQDAFDKGYPLGVELGLRVGEVLGVLEGVVGALKVGVKGDGGLVRDEGTGERRRKLKEMEEVLERARRELDVKALLAGVEEGSVADAEGIDRLDSVEETVRQWERQILGRWAEGDEAKLVKGEAATDIQRIGHPGHAKEVG